MYFILCFFSFSISTIMITNLLMVFIKMSSILLVLLIIYKSICNFKQYGHNDKCLSREKKV